MILLSLKKLLGNSSSVEDLQKAYLIGIGIKDTLPIVENNPLPKIDDAIS